MKIRNLLDRCALRHVQDVPDDVIFAYAENAAARLCSELSELAAFGERLGALYETDAITPEQNKAAVALALLQSKIFGELSNQIAPLKTRFSQILDS